MLALDIQHVRMKQHATDKAQALQCLVDILVEDHWLHLIIFMG